jgi:hypothetical protein
MLITVHPTDLQMQIQGSRNKHPLLWPTGVKESAPPCSWPTGVEDPLLVANIDFLNQISYNSKIRDPETGIFAYFIYFYHDCLFLQFFTLLQVFLVDMSFLGSKHIADIFSKSSVYKRLTGSL